MAQQPIIQQLFSQAVTLHQAGKLTEAETAYRTVLTSEPGHADALKLLGTVYFQTGRAEEGIALVEKSLEINPAQPDAFANKGLALHQLQRFGEALASYNKAIALAPRYTDAYRNRGDTLHELQRYDEAVASYNEAITLNPNYAEAYNNRALSLREAKRYDEALASGDRAIALQPHYPVAYNNRGIILHKMQRFGEALASFDKAIALKPDYAEAYSNRGVILQKMARYEEALASFDKAIALKPDYAKAYYGQGNVFQALDQYDKAKVSYGKAIALNPAIPALWGDLCYAKMQLCDWQERHADLGRIKAYIQAGEYAASTFVVLGALPEPSLQKRYAEIYTKDQFPPSASPLWQGENYAHGRIRVGYFSADFYNHATACLMAEFFELHDRSSFEVTAFSFGQDIQDAMQQRLKKSFGHFIDVSAKSDREIAMLARQMEMDIAIDLKGFSKDSRAGIFAQRLAPVQAQYLGYPGTMGASYIDYLIADPIVVPADSRQYFTEKIACLPYSYQVNDSSRKFSEKLYTRKEMGLPEHGFVFCSFNNSYKITPDVFTLWMRLLQKVDGSVLWLFAGDNAAEKNLRAEAVARGVAPERLIFAGRMKHADHLARYQLADLFLDTLPCNAHTTASDALWEGLPVLTCAGNSFAGRVAASLLHAVGLPELVTQSHAAYEMLALELATNPQKLAAIRDKLAQNRTTYPLFNTRLFTQHFEEALTKMWERSQAGLPPDHIYIKPTNV